MSTTATQPAAHPFSTPESRAAAPCRVKIYFKDGNEIHRYGFYNSGRFTVAKEKQFDYSKKSCINFVNKRASAIERAIIYAMHEVGKPEIARFEYGLWKDAQ